mmetsp:Transcript_49801/g.138056  ORF Transcript_49801/g.138056 Transcript_49801/m.138056 type:complete len:295 (-) Transcript_49801:191-1075(-)
MRRVGGCTTSKGTGRSNPATAVVAAAADDVQQCPFSRQIRIRPREHATVDDKGAGIPIPNSCFISLFLRGSQTLRFEPPVDVAIARDPPCSGKGRAPPPGLGPPVVTVSTELPPVGSHRCDLAYDGIRWPASPTPLKGLALATTRRPAAGHRPPTLVWPNAPFVRFCILAERLEHHDVADALSPQGRLRVLRRVRAHTLCEERRRWERQRIARAPRFISGTQEPSQLRKSSGDDFFWWRRIFTPPRLPVSDCLELCLRRHVSLDDTRRKLRPRAAHRKRRVEIAPPPSRFRMTG